VIGVCLAAGFGTRLKPLSEVIPKAGLPVMGVSSMYYSLDSFEKAGFFDVFVNTHHLAPKIRDLITNPYWQSSKLNITESFEPTLLGTAGVYRPIIAQRPDEAKGIVALNADIICDFEITNFLEHIDHHRPHVSMVVLDSQDGSNIHTKAGVVTGFAPGGDKFGAGMFYLSAEFLRSLPSTSFDLLPEIERSIKAGAKVSVYEHKGFWLDFGGSIKQYFHSHQQIARSSQFFAEKVNPLYQKLFSKTLHVLDDHSVVDDSCLAMKDNIQGSYVFSSQISALVCNSLVVDSQLEKSVSDLISIENKMFAL
jgi:NDP-sugar pyrophosphorylase family protein